MGLVTTPAIVGTSKHMPESALQLRNSIKNTIETLFTSDVTHVVVIFSEDQCRAIMEAIGAEYQASFPYPSWDYITVGASKSLFDAQAVLRTNTLGSQSIGKSMCVKLYILCDILLRPPLAASWFLLKTISYLICQRVDFQAAENTRIALLELKIGKNLVASTWEYSMMDATPEIDRRVRDCEYPQSRLMPVDCAETPSSCPWSVWREGLLDKIGQWSWSGLSDNDISFWERSVKMPRLCMSHFSVHTWYAEYIIGLNLALETGHDPFKKSKYAGRDKDPGVMRLFNEGETGNQFFTATHSLRFVS